MGERDRLPGHRPSVVHPRRRRHRDRRRRRRACAAIAATGLAASPISEILIERSIAGWKEYELEVMRDRADNCVVICSIENFDPMGVHTGDSITVAPAQTLSDVEYQRMRDAAFACIRRIGVETGGSNIQFAVDPTDGRHGRHRDEPTGRRVRARWRPRPPASRSPRSPPAWPSATRSTRSATTSPGRRRPASSRPSTTWSPRSPGGPSRSFPGSPTCSAPGCSRSARPWPSAARSPSRCRRGCAPSSTAASGSTAIRPKALYDALADDELVRQAAIATPDRPFQLEAALRRGISVERLHEATGVDPWFLDQIA